MKVTLQLLSRMIFTMQSTITDTGKSFHDQRTSRAGVIPSSASHSTQKENA